MAELRETHYEDRPLRSVCHDCEEPWPCPTTRLLAERAQLRDDNFVLRYERDDAESETRVLRGQKWETYERIAAAHGERDALAARLRAVTPYVQHTEQCVKAQNEWWDTATPGQVVQPIPCICGLKSALGGSTRGGTK